MVDSIDSLGVDDPKEFWAQIQKLGPRVKASIPLKIRDGNNFITEETEVLKRWEHEFNDLLNNEGTQLMMMNFFKIPNVSEMT